MRNEDHEDFLKAVALWPDKFGEVIAPILRDLAAAFEWTSLPKLRTLLEARKYHPLLPSVAPELSVKNQNVVPQHLLEEEDEEEEEEDEEQ